MWQSNVEFHILVQDPSSLVKDLTVYAQNGWMQVLAPAVAGNIDLDIVVRVAVVFSEMWERAAVFSLSQGFRLIWCCMWNKQVGIDLETSLCC